MKTVFCPIKCGEIDGIDCLLICDVADRFINPRVLPEGIIWDEQKRERCKQCKYHADIE